MTRSGLGFGPGTLVAAAFIGPGTVATCTLAGAGFGFALLWALLFATIATIVLQEMAARLGTVGRTGLGEALREDITAPPLSWPVFALVGLAILAGNAAYQGGNLAGAALGAELLGAPKDGRPAAVLAVALLAAALLWHGRYRHIERLLVVLVALMAAAFVGAAVLARPDLGAMARGLFVPSLPDGATLTALALIGTTVVPYNLFLHASAAKARWSGAEELDAARRDTGLSIGIGGLVSMMIVAAAATTLFQSGAATGGVDDLAAALAPAAGRFAAVLVGLGLLAAGLTSSITAPLATGYALAGIMGWDSEGRGLAVRATSLVIVLIGSALALSGFRPLDLIVAAQAANGLLLPIIAGFLLWTMNRRGRLGAHANGWAANLAGGAVLLVTILLGGRLIGLAFGLI
ncbi:MAG: Nramp family divalent metal transporter [Pacificimonas sp.]|jgi:Mn2+/Fe2+ NRAMP family transporter|nr:Nramp family divalent metal transporter [Pacificimonas sp.]